MSQHTKTPIEAYRFSAPVDLMGEQDKPKEFSGIAYTGDILSHGFWEHVAFELSSITAPESLPMLIGHDRDKNAGFSKSVTIDDKGIAVSGVLLSNEDGERIAQDAAEGFPWQMSVHIDPKDIIEVEAGFKVNGRTFEKAGVVFKNATIREISFTPTGVDANTSTKVFSRSTQFEQGQSPESKEGQSMTMTKEEAAALKAENDALKTQFSEVKASNEALKEQFTAMKDAAADAKAAQRDAAIAALNFACTDAQKEAMKSMTDEQFSVTADLIQAQQAAIPEALFSETFNQGADAGGEDEIMKGMLAGLEAAQGA